MNTEAIKAHPSELDQVARGDLTDAAQFSTDSGNNGAKSLTDEIREWEDRAEYHALGARNNKRNGGAADVRPTAIARAASPARPESGVVLADQPHHTDRSQDGASFILDPEESVPSLWGDPDAIAWAAGEPLMICGPQGVGKTTLLQQLALRRSGVVGGNLLDMPVAVGPERVLYIAADRPRQIARSFRRMVDEDQRGALARALIIWRGPLPFDLGKARPGQLKEFVAGFGEVDTVFIDSLKDVAINLADSEVGSRVNAEFQELITSGVNLGVTHHQRKASGDNKKPKRLDDVFGSAWLTSGIGSVLLLWGDAGRPDRRA